MSNLPEKTKDSTPSLPERAEHREWIGGRALTLLGHYFRPDDPVQMTAAIGRDWADVLEGLPQSAIQQACIAYQRQEPRRKPTPGDIYQLARDMIPKPRPAPVRPETPAEREARLAEQARRPVYDPVRAKQAQAIIKQAGLELKP